MQFTAVEIKLAFTENILKEFRISTFAISERKKTFPPHIYHQTSQCTAISIPLASCHIKLPLTNEWHNQRMANSHSIQHFYLPRQKCKFLRTHIQFIEHLRSQTFSVITLSAYEKAEDF